VMSLHLLSHEEARAEAVRLQSKTARNAPGKFAAGKSQRHFEVPGELPESVRAAIQAQSHNRFRSAKQTFEEDEDEAQELPDRFTEAEAYAEAVRIQSEMSRNRPGKFKNSEKSQRHFEREDIEAQLEVTACSPRSPTEGGCVACSGDALRKLQRSHEELEKILAAMRDDLADETKARFRAEKEIEELKKQLADRTTVDKIVYVDRMVEVEKGAAVTPIGEVQNPVQQPDDMPEDAEDNTPLTGQSICTYELEGDIDKFTNDIFIEWLHSALCQTSNALTLDRIQYIAASEGPENDGVASFFVTLMLDFTALEDQVLNGRKLLRSVVNLTTARGFMVTGVIVHPPH